MCEGYSLKNCNFAAEFKIIAMEFTGKIIAILPPRGGVSKTSGNEWKSQEYVIENHDQYPRKMCFDVFGADKIEQFNIQMGEELTVSFDIDARQWNDRWFNSIRAWKSRTRWRRCSDGSRFSRSSPTSVSYAENSLPGMPERRSAILNRKPFAGRISIKNSR